MRLNEPVTNHEIMYGQDEMLVSKTDTGGEITYCNSRFMAVAGFTEKELLGEAHNIVRHPDMPRAAFEDLWDTVSTGGEWLGVVKNRCKNGDFYWVSATVTPSYDQAGNIIGYMSVRRFPSRAQVQEAEVLYAQMRKAGR